MTLTPVPGIRDLLGRPESADDVYAALDGEWVTRVGGVLWLGGIALVLTMLPLAPLDLTIGPAGWWVTGVLAVPAIAYGLAATLRPRLVPPERQLLPAVAGALILGMLQVFGGAEAPYGMTLLPLVAYHAALHPRRRAFGLIAFTALVAGVSILATEHQGPDAARAIVLAELVAMLGLVAYVFARLNRHLSSRLRDSLVRVEEHRRNAEQSARIDPLTGLGNRRAFDTSIEGTISASARYGRPLSVLMLDVDNFKAVNDRSGHDAGDLVLERVAGALVASTRQPDRCFRWGGDEFLAVLPETTGPGAEIAANRVEEAIRRAGSEVSVGWAEWHPGDTVDALVHRADQGLLSVKRLHHRV